MTNIFKFSLFLLSLVFLSFTTKEELPPGLSIANMSIAETSANCYVVSFDIAGSPAYRSEVTYTFGGQQFSIGERAPGYHYTSDPLCFNVANSNTRNCSLTLVCAITDPLLGLQLDGCVIVIDGCRRLTYIPPTSTPIFPGLN